MTPTKRSPLLEVDSFAKRNAFTPTKLSPSRRTEREKYVTSSPSKLRTTLAAHSKSTPTNRSPRRVTDRDAVLSEALVAYTPRTKARKRLRGEDVPPTPQQERRRPGQVAMRSKTEPRPKVAQQQGLGAFGFASQRKVLGEANRSVTAPASVFSRARRSLGGEAAADDDDEDEEMLGESPIKAVAKLRRTASAKPGFKPLFCFAFGQSRPERHPRHQQHRDLWWPKSYTQRRESRRGGGRGRGDGR